MSNDSNTNLGQYSLFYNKGINNTAVGASTLANNSSANNNTGLGAYSLAKNTTGKNNVAIGANAQLNNTIGDNNVSVGPASLQNNVGSVNTAIGANSLQNNTTGYSNVAVGAASGLSDISGINNTFLGAYTDVSNNGFVYSNSTAIGYNAIIDASNQIMIGTVNETTEIPGKLLLTSINPVESNQATTKSYVDSIASGIHPTTACNCATTQSIVLSGLPIIDGYQVQSGDRVLVKNQNGTDTSGNFTNTDDINNGIYIASGGAWARASDCSTGDVVSNQTTYILFGTTNTYKSFIQLTQNAIVGTSLLTYGIFSTSAYTIGPGLEINSNAQIQIIPELKGVLTFVGIGGAVNSTNYALDVSGAIHTNTTLTVDKTSTLTGNVGIGKASTAYALDVSGNINSSATVSAVKFNTTSDYRIKDNVKLLEASFSVDNLKPVTYFNKLSSKQDIGLIAHELQEYYPCLVTGEKDGIENQTVNYIGLIPVLIKEIQDLKKENVILNQKINILNMK